MLCCSIHAKLIKVISLFYVDCLCCSLLRMLLNEVAVELSLLFLLDYSNDLISYNS